MHDPAERSDVANSVAHLVPDGKSESEPDKLTDADAFADHVAIVRSVERALDQRRVGARRGNSPLPIV